MSPSVALLARLVNISVTENYLFVGQESSMNMIFEMEYKLRDNKCRTEPISAQAIILKSSEPNLSFSSNPFRTKSQIGA